MASSSALDLKWSPGADAAFLRELLHATLDAFEPHAIHDFESDDGWRVFFRSGAQRDRALAALRATHGSDLLSIEAADVPDDDWARRSQRELNAVRIGRIVVAPPWDLPTPGPESPEPRDPDLLIVIDPSTGFGTGHHETTRLCLGLMQGVDLKGKRVIDAGTGSGVLAIAAYRLGAREVIGFDEDAEALRNARENVERNHAESIIDLIETDLASVPGTMSPAALVTANLTGPVLQKYSERLTTLVAPGGLILISGFNRDELDEIVADFPHSERQHAFEGDWASALLRLL